MIFLKILRTQQQQQQQHFPFYIITLSNSLKDFKNLNSKNAVQATDTPTKIIKENKDL